MTTVAAPKAMPREMLLYFFYKAISLDIQICFMCGPRRNSGETSISGLGSVAVPIPVLTYCVLCPVHFVLVYSVGSVRY